MANTRTRAKRKYIAGQPLRVWIIVGLLFVLLVAVESVALHNAFTSKFPSGNDFYVRWLGGREYLLNGTNPFDRSVAEKAQTAMFGRLTTPEDRDEAYFAYPLYTLYFFWPLSLAPYPWAQAIWMTLLQFMLLAVTVLSIRLSGWRPPGWLFWISVFWGVFFYNGARAILLGQFSILVGLALMLALWAIQEQRFAWAGVLLSITTIKPQMVLLLLIFLLLWALVYKKWRLIISFGISMLVLMLTSMALVPSWPLDFYYNIIAYSGYVSHGTPLENLLHYLLPASMASPLTVILSILFFLALLPGWAKALGLDTQIAKWRNSNSELKQNGKPQSKIVNPTPLRFGDYSRKSKIETAYIWSIMTTLIVSSLITFRSATTNQVILYLPLFFYFYRLTLAFSSKTDTPNSKANFIAVLIEAGLLIFMWVVFAATIKGNYEHIMMHGLLPAIMLLVYALDWRGLWRAAATLSQSTTPPSG